MTSPRMPRVRWPYIPVGCDQQGRLNEGVRVQDDDDNFPMTLDDLVCVVLVVGIFAMLVWAEPLGRLIERIVQ